MRRQAGLMRKVQSARQVLDRADMIADAVRQYRRFLELARGTDQPLAPTVPIDLAWVREPFHVCQTSLMDWVV